MSEVNNAGCCPLCGDINYFHVFLNNFVDYTINDDTIIDVEVEGKM